MTISEMYEKYEIIPNLQGHQLTMSEKFLQLLSAVLGLLSSISFFMGSKQKPWEIQTWGNESEKEKSFKKKRIQYNQFAFLLLGFSFLIQIIVLVF